MQTVSSCDYVSMLSGFSLDEVLHYTEQFMSLLGDNDIKYFLFRCSYMALPGELRLVSVQLLVL